MAPSRQWGQNFLVDRTVLEPIADLALTDRPFRVLEIGPGVGGLTLTLLERDAFVHAIELDGRVLPVLDHLGARFPGHLSVQFDDALAVSWAEIIVSLGWNDGPITVVGNLPYYITAPIIGHLMEETSLWWDRAVFMVQREVAERLLALPGQRAASTLGVLLRYRARVEAGIDVVSPDSFYPVPEVFSSVIQLVPTDPLPVDWETYRWIVKAGFSHRRKMLRQSLAQANGSPWSKNEWQAFLEELDILSSARAEALTLEEWTKLASAFEQRK